MKILYDGGTIVLLYIDFDIEGSITSCINKADEFRDCLPIFRNYNVIDEATIILKLIRIADTVSQGLEFVHEL